MLTESALLKSKNTISNILFCGDERRLNQGTTKPRDYIINIIRGV